MGLFDSFKSKKDTKIVDSYELFLSKIDELSCHRLKAIDMSLDVIRVDLLEDGFTLGEIECVSPLVTLKRNQFGFYVDETKSLNSKDDYRNYLYGVEYLEKNKELFKRIDQLLIDKEFIMRGSYKINSGSEKELSELAHNLGYGVIRDRQIYEEEPVHPSDEHVQLEILLDLVNNPEVKKIDTIINKCMKKIQDCFNEFCSIEIKRLSDTYDVDYDHTYGIMLVDQNLGERFMIYYSDGVGVRKSSFEKYLVNNNPYLIIYMRIILKCLQKELSLNDNKRRGK